MKPRHAAVALTASFLALVFAAHASAQKPPADTRPAFSLSTSEVFTTRDAPSFYLTFRRVEHLDFRVYKVRDPFAFFVVEFVKRSGHPVP